MKIKHLPSYLGLGFALAISGVVSRTSPAQAQSGNFSDVTGAIVTTSDIVGGFSPGGDRRVDIVFQNSQIQQAVNSAATSVNQQLATGNLPIAATGPSTPIPTIVQKNCECVVTGGSNAAECATQLERALVSAGANPTLARNLANSLRGLNSDATVNAEQFRAVVRAYNALIGSSSADFLRNPPQELRAIQSVLSILLNAALGRS
ncbi:MAG TPA: hypothetical protein V6D14_29710 [Coleofasciculaceae cyanobacterium]|jgi:hypothetical protein